MTAGCFQMARAEYSSRLWGLAAVSFVILVAPGAPTPHAEDRVTIQREGSTGTMTLVGEVEEYTSRRLSIRLKSTGSRQSFGAADVLSVSTSHSTPHQRALEAFDAGDYALAEQHLAEALASEGREWVQQDLLSQLVRCAMRRGDRTSAAAYFIQMIAREPESRHWGIAPLIWAAEPVRDDLRAAAEEWLRGSQPAARLLGGSILLLDKTHADSARRALDDLARSPDPFVQSLARAQLWRLQLVGGGVSAYQLQSWRDQVESMPPQVRAGPLYILGRVAALRSDLEQAAADWLWLPLVYSEEESLAARACVEAANALSRLGRPGEAATLYREASERFSWSPFAAEARQRLQEITTQGGADGG